MRRELWIIRFLESDTARRLREESKSGDVTIASFVEHDRSKIFGLKLIWRNRTQVRWRVITILQLQRSID